MYRWPFIALLAVAFVGGAIAVQFLPPVNSAVAQDSGATAETDDTPTATETADADTDAVVAEGDQAVVADSGGGRLLCRLFLVDVRDVDTWDTADRTTEIGQWVGEQTDAGLFLYSLDFEVGQKPTGYPQGYLTVCVYPGA